LNLKSPIVEDNSIINNMTSTKSAMNSIPLDSNIPSGDWTLYYHPSEGRDWTLPSFTSFGAMKTWRDFHTIIGAIEESTLSDGMFFFMRNPIPPLWENHKNIYGGAYSISVIKEDAGSVFVEYAIAAMLNSSTHNTANIVNGLSISPKKSHNIIKIWNTDAAKFKLGSDLVKLIPDMRAEDVRFTPFVDKKM